ncbi:MAG: T9SS type A sorting domain-containing protein [Bacteroidia bacterium]|nr:T9SS type A sorting domain-containing protein [Bacteroidia bacterium]
MKNIIIFISALVFSTNVINGQQPIFQWVKSLPTGTVVVNDVAIDISGNQFYVGTFKGSNIDFDPGVGTTTLSSFSPTLEDPFILKLNSNGVFQWVKTYNTGTGSGISQLIAVDVDPTGNLYLQGYCEDIAFVDFDPGPATYTMQVSYDTHVLKLDNNGNFLWVKRIRRVTGGPLKYIQDIKSDASGVYATGWFEGSVDLDPSPASAVVTASALPLNYSSYLVKLDASGNYVWGGSQLIANGSGAEYCGKMSLDPSGNLITCGTFKGILDFDLGPSTSTFTNTGSTYKTYVIKRAANSGNVLFAKVFDADRRAGVVSSADNIGNIYVGGTFYGTVDFDPGAGTTTLTCASGTLLPNGYLSKLDANGNFLYVKSLSSSNADIDVTDLKVDPNDNTYMAGYLAGSVDFDPSLTGTMNVLGNNGAGFINKLDVSGNFVWNRVYDSNPGTGSENIYNIAIDNTLNIYAVGVVSNGGIVNFDPPALGTNTLSFASPYSFLLKLSNCLLPTNNTPIVNQNICANTSAILLANGTGTINWFTTLIGGSSIASGNSYTTPALSTGNHTYYAESSNCTANGSRIPITITVSSCSGIKEFNELLNVLAYPNPVKELLTIQLNEKATVCVFDNFGKIVLQKQLTAGINTVDLENYSTGIYLFKLQANDKTKMLRIVKD